MPVEQLDISETLTWVDGLPRPQWDLVRTWVETRVAPDDCHAAWTALGRQWLEKLAPTLGQSYRVDESQHFFLLVPQPGPPIAVVLRFAENCRRVLQTALPGIADFRVPGKQVVLVLRNGDDYYKYLSVFYPEGHHGGSAGVQIREGYAHVALCGTNLDQLENSLAHELTHFSLCGLSLPQWVEEGLAQLFEHNMTGRALLLVDGEMARRHKRYWGKHSLTGFWRGEGFSSPSKMQELSYQLAEILIRLLFEEHRPTWFGWNKEPQRRLLSFLGEANVVDSGEAAARAHLGFGLGELAARFLGAGEWGLRL